MPARRVIAERFELLAQAAKGAMGFVHRAKDLTTGGLVAVKLVELERVIDHGRFARECELLATVQHPNVVRYVAHGKIGEGVHYLAQEWVDGVDVRTQVRTF